MTGEDSSSSPPSSWPDEHAHSGRHFTLLVFPDGRLIITCPDYIPEDEFQNIADLVRTWANSSDSVPLVIGSCQVVLQSLAPRTFEAVRAIR